MATSPSLACERKGTNRVNAIDESMAKSVGWVEGDNGAGAGCVCGVCVGGDQTQATEPLKAEGISDCYTTAHKQEPFLQCGIHHPAGLGLPSPCPASSETVPHPAPHPFFILRESKPCLLLAACISQDGFHMTKCHLFALLDQRKKRCMGAWDADRWPLARQQS